MGEVRADLQRVDPVKYAWARCNPGIPLPAVLARSAFIDPNTARAGGELTAAKALATKVAHAAKAVTHSGIVRRRMPRAPVEHLKADRPSMPNSPAAGNGHDVRERDSELVNPVPFDGRIGSAGAPRNSR